MIIYTIKSFWNHYGWSIIFYGSIICLIILFIYNIYSNIFTPSSDTSLSQIFKQIFLNENDSNSIITSYKKQYFSNNNSPKITNQSKGEKICNDFLEFYFNKKFERIRPNFLLNPVTHQNLEIDCYNDELKLAVEYNGKQHYEYNSMMHQQSKHAFQNQQYRDYIKQTLCKQNGIHLIIVPYTIPLDKIPNYLYDQLKKSGYNQNQLL